MNLARLLIDHPFSDEEGLLHTADCTLTAGEARAAAHACARALGDVAGRAVPVSLPNGPELVIDAELDALCRQHLVAYKVPVAYHWVDALPRNEAGKVLRAELVRGLS